MKVSWSRLAVEDIRAIRAHIGEHDYSAAQRIAQIITSHINTFLPDNPHLGRPGRVPGTREFVVSKTPFIVPYRVSNGRIRILRVYHGARRWPERF